MDSYAGDNCVWWRATVLSGVGFVRVLNQQMGCCDVTFAGLDWDSTAKWVIIYHLWVMIDENKWVKRRLLIHVNVDYANLWNFYDFILETFKLKTQLKPSSCSVWITFHPSRTSHDKTFDKHDTLEAKRLTRQLNNKSSTTFTFSAVRHTNINAQIFE